MKLRTSAFARRRGNDSEQHASDSGNVVVEFIGLVAALLLPIVFVATSCWEVACSYFAVSSAAHAAGRAFVVTSSESDARLRVQRIEKVVMNEYGLSTRSLHSSISCSQKPCLTPGGLVTVAISRDLALSIPFFGQRHVTVWGTHSAVVDEAR